MIGPIQGIYALCDTTYCPQKTHARLAEELLEGGIQILQLRMKGMRDPDRIRRTAEQILQLKKKYDFIFILNDYVDLAAELQTDGVHVGRDDPPIPEVLKKVSSKTLVGYSSHSLAEAVRAEQQGAHYVALGAIFPTPAKGPDHPVLGPKLLQEVVQTLKIPVVAIGGINRDNLREVLQTGVAAVAMIRALTAGRDIPQRARNFVALFDGLRR